MFGKFMNNYYYGKSGKGDYNPEDLPRTRWQLFWEMLRTRLSGLCRLNLMYVLAWAPMMVVVGMLVTSTLEVLSHPDNVTWTLQQINAAEEDADGNVSVAMQDGSTQLFTAQEIQTMREAAAAPLEEVRAWQASSIQSGLLRALLLLIPCIFITGPWTAGVTYVTRNWARDEHAFIWSDMKDAMKENWKGSLVLSGITAVIPAIVYMCWTFYGSVPTDDVFMSILLQLGQMIPVMVGVIWYMAITYAYPMLVTYKMSMRTVIRNSLILAVGRLPQSVGMRLLHCVPLLIAVMVSFLNIMWALIGYMVYYVLIGFSLSRFVTASYTNAQFDKYINSRIEGAKVNQGLAEDDGDDDEDEKEEHELKPWENGYANRDDA